MTKAPSRSFRHKPEKADDDSVTSAKKKVSRSSRPEGTSGSSSRKLTSSSSSRRVSSQVSS
jgi:hypothetical protein